MEVAIVKILVLTGLFILTFSLGLIPISLVSIFRKHRRRKSRRYAYFKIILSLLSCYAAGVFLSTCLLDLLPDVRSNLTTVFSELNVDTTYPVSEFIMCFGLFLVLIVEQIVLSVKERSLAKSFQVTSNGDKKTSTTGNNIIQSSDTNPLLSDSDASFDYESRSCDEPDHKTRTRSLTASSTLSEHSISGISDEPCPKVVYKQDRQHRIDSINEESHCTNDSDNDMNLEQERQQSTLRSLLLLIALSLHSVFEGLAVGLQKTSADVLGIFAALLLHKCILSFSLGMNLVQSRLSRGNCIKSIFLFSSTSPVGIAVGIGIEGLWDSVSSNLVQGVLQGIAAGTFLYVTFFEVLPHEFNNSETRLGKLAFLLLGFSTVAAVLFLD